VCDKEIFIHGGWPGDTVQALASLWHTGSSGEAQDVLHWAISPTSYRHIRMAKNSSNGMVQAWVGQKLLNVTFEEFFDV
jgi:hypothetical protein